MSEPVWIVMQQTEGFHIFHGVFDTKDSASEWVQGKCGYAPTDLGELPPDTPSGPEGFKDVTEHYIQKITPQHYSLWGKS